MFGRPSSRRAALRACFALLFFPLLGGCGGGGGSSSSAPPDNGPPIAVLKDSYAVLGPISGGTVQILDLGGKPLKTVTASTLTYNESRDTVVSNGKRYFRSYAEGRRVGLLQVTLDPTVQIDEGSLYVVEVSGGTDVDPNDDGVIDSNEGASGPAFLGSARAVVSGSSLLAGSVRINVLTELACAALQGSSDPVAIRARLDRFAAFELKDAAAGDINRDGKVDYQDLLVYDPSVFKANADGTLTGVAAGYLRSVSLLQHMLAVQNAQGQTYEDQLHAGGGPATTEQFMLGQFGNHGNDGVADVFNPPLGSDADDDGIPNDIELKLGLNPFNADSYGDGILDGNRDSDSDGLGNLAEINTYKTDPGNPDTDGDGIKDGDEVKYGLDPLDPTDAAKDKDSDGLSNIDEINTYKTDPTNPDTDGDGLTDGDEVKVYHTDPLKKDSDGDGLTDGEEVNVYHTDPLKKDTDGDGISDGDEVKGFTLYDGVTVVHTDPLMADTDGDGISDGIEKQVQDMFAKYPHPDNAKACLTGPLNPNNPAARPNLGGLKFLDPALSEAALEADPDGDGKPTIEEICMGTNPNSKSDTFQYVYEAGDGSAKPEFQAMQAAGFVYVPGAWDVTGEGVQRSGFFIAAYDAKDSGTALPAARHVTDLLQGGQVYNATKKTYADRLCNNGASGKDTDSTDSTGSCRGNQYGAAGVATIDGTGVHGAVFTPAGAPYVGLSWLEARASLLASQVDAAGSMGGPYAVDLPSELQWMQLVQTVINNPVNWTSGQVGAGAVYRGHSDGVPAMPLPVSHTADRYSDTGNSSADGPDQGRYFVVANGIVTRDFSLPLNYSAKVWDLSGNVSQWTLGLYGSLAATSTSRTRTGGDHFADGLSELFDYSGTNLSGAGTAITTMPGWLKPARGRTTVLVRVFGAGVYNDGSPDSDTDGNGVSNGSYSSFDVGYGQNSYVDHYAAVLRGAPFSTGSNAGVAGLDLENGVSRRLANAGFRAAR
jgi:hypothetical protein